MVNSEKPSFYFKNKRNDYKIGKRHIDHTHNYNTNTISTKITFKQILNETNKLHCLRAGRACNIEYITFFAIDRTSLDNGFCHIGQQATGVSMRFSMGLQIRNARKTIATCLAHESFNAGVQ